MKHGAFETLAFGFRLDDDLVRVFGIKHQLVEDVIDDYIDLVGGNFIVHESSFSSASG